MIIYRERPQNNVHPQRGKEKKEGGEDLPDWSCGRVAIIVKENNGRVE